MIKARRRTLNILTFSVGVTLVAALPFSTVVAKDARARTIHSAVLAQNSAEAVSPTEFEAESSKNHETVAKYYEDSAAEMRAKAQEQKLLLDQYEDKSYLYGKKAQDLQAHTTALIRRYEQAAEADAKKADTHRKIASRLKDNLAGESKPNAMNSSRR